ncbi:MAG: PAS domain-containing protein [Thermoguttaceae bacterium]
MSETAWSADWKEIQSLLHVGSWVYTPATEQESWTKELCHLLGISDIDPAQVVERPFRMIDRFPQIRTLLEEQLQKKQEQGALTVLCPICLSGKKRQTRPFLLKTRLRVEEEGKTEQILCVLQDVTPVLSDCLLPQSLPQISDRFLQAVYACPDIFFLELDTHWTIRYYDPRYPAYYGYQLGDATGSSARDFFRDAPEILQGIEKTLEGNSTQVLSERYGRTMKMRLFPQFDNKGKVQGVLGVGLDVTEQMEAEHARRNEEQKYRTLFENTSEMVALLKEGTVLLCNPNMLKLLDVENFGDVLGRKPSEVIPPQPDIEGVPYDVFLEQKLQTVQSGVHLEFECTYRKRNGTRYFLNVQIIPLVLANELLEMILVHDISQHKQVAEFAKEQDRLLKTVCNGIQNGIFVVDREYRVIYANPYGQRMLAVKGTVLGSICYEKAYNRNQVCEHCPVAETFRTQLPVRTKRYDPEFDLWVELSSFPLFEEMTGEIIGAVEMVQNITDSQKAHLELQKRESLLADVLHGIPDGLLIIDREFTILQANRAIEEQLQDIAPLAGQKCYGRSPKKTVCEHCPAQEAFTTGETVSVELFEPAFDPRPGVWIEHIAHPIVDPLSGTVDRALCVLRDITEQKQVVEELQRNQSLLRQLQKEI